MITTDLNRAEYTGNGSATEYVFASGGTNIPVKDASHIKVYVTNTGTFTANSTTNVFTDTSHGHLDTQVIRVSGATALPTGLLSNTDYYVRDKTDDTFKLALASGDTAITISDTGTGTLTWKKTLLKSISTDYTVSLSGTTATVTFNSAPASGVAILFIREVPYQQNTDLLNNSLIEAESLESQLDLIVNQVQQLKNTTERDIRFSDTLSATDATETQAVLNVTKTDRANKGLKFDANGNIAVSSIDLEKAEDYVLDSKDYATTTGGNVSTYDAGQPTSTSDYSAKEWAVGTTTTSAKEYATKTSGAVTGTDFSAKEYAHGTQASTGGSAKDYAQKTDGGVSGATSDHSAKAWALGGTGVTDTATKGSSKQWAIGGGSGFAIANKVDGSSGSYSSKAYAQSTTAGTSTYGGSAKGWASTAHGAAVPGAGADDRSALHYATDASNSATEAKNSAAAVSQVYDNFSDVYLGSMRSDKSSADAVTLTGASWSKDSSSIAFTGTSSGTVTIGQELTSTGTGYPVGANIIGSQTTSPIVISNAFTVAGSGATLVFQGSGVYGAFNSTTGGPSTNNDGDALISGNLYFNSQENEMRIYDGANWIAATSAGDTSLLEYKFVTTSGQVTSKTYSGSADVGGTLSYTQDNIIVFMNGIQLKNGVDYTATNGSSIVLTNSATVNDEIAVIAFKSFTTADMVSKSSGGTFASEVTMPTLKLSSNVIKASDGGSTITLDTSDNVTIAGALGASNLVGMIAPFAMASAPTGWLICDGSAVSRSTYANLFSALSTTWGAGDGSSTFNLPDFRGAFLRGTGSHGTSNMADGNDFAGPAVGSFENDQIQAHRHAIFVNDTGSGNNTVAFLGLGTGGGASFDKSFASGSPRMNMEAGTDNPTDVSTGDKEDYGDPRRGDETRPFNAGVNYCIKY